MIETQPKRSRIAWLVAAPLLAACGESMGPGLDDALVRDVAVLAADATIEDVTLWSQPLGGGLSPVAGAEPSLLPGRPGGAFGWSGAFSGTRSITFLDADGVEQPGFDPQTTESIHIEHEIQGEVTRDGWSASVHRLRDMTVSGLAGTETHRTWNGTGNEDISRSRHLEDDAVRSYESTATWAYEDVVVPIPGSDPRWPVSGTIRRSMTVERSGPDGDVTRTLEIVITFDGTSIAIAEVNGEIVEIDLSTRPGGYPLRPRPPRG